jgi:hypothetical protein
MVSVEIHIGTNFVSLHLKNKTANANETTLSLRPDKYSPNRQNYFCFLKIIKSTYVTYIFVITYVTHNISWI